MTLMRMTVSFPTLLDDCWRILQGLAYPFYPGSGRGSPSLTVCVFPGLTQWDWNLWETLVGPLLITLGEGGSPPGGWGTSMGRSRVEAALRLGLTSSPWIGRVDWGT